MSIPQRATIFISKGIFASGATSMPGETLSFVVGRNFLLPDADRARELEADFRLPDNATLHRLQSNRFSMLEPSELRCVAKKQVLEVTLQSGP